MDSRLWMVAPDGRVKGTERTYGMALEIVTLSREPLTEGSIRYYTPGQTESATDSGPAIIVCGVRPDCLGAALPEQRYGAVAIMTVDGLRTVSSLDLGVLVIDTDADAGII